MPCVPGTAQNKTGSENCTECEVDYFAAYKEETACKRCESGNELKRRGMCSYCELITGARVPIIKMTHLETGTDADICFNQTSGPRMGKMIKFMLNVVPAMKPLVSIQ